jgi:cytochrome d ubiquinol oxidase subunit I
MQNPVGAEFNFETMRMEMVSFSEVVLNPVAQVAKFVHTVVSGYTCGAMFVLGISTYYLLKGRDIAFARRSFAIAASFGTAAILSTIVLGDESGYELGEVQKVKLAAVEAEWHTEPAPAAFTVFGLPNQETMETDYTQTTSRCRIQSLIFCFSSRKRTQRNDESFPSSLTMKWDRR